jgi:hypothetical protein
MPVELLLLALEPRYYSVGKSRFEGVGHAGIGDEEFSKARSMLLDVFIHVRRAGTTPLIAHKSRVFEIDKRNDKQGVDAVRVLHLLCILWSNYHGQLLDKGLKEYDGRCKAEGNEIWKSYQHGYLPGRRREGAMAVQRVMSERLARLGIDCINDLEDMTNAFACTRNESRVQTINELVRADDRLLFVQRVTNSVVQFVVGSGTLEVIPSTGNLMGSKEAPSFFFVASNATRSSPG